MESTLNISIIKAPREKSQLALVPSLGVFSKDGIMQLINISTPKYPHTYTIVDGDDYFWLMRWKWLAVCGSSGIYYATRTTGRDKKKRRSCI